MIKIKELKGFKYIGPSPYWVRNNDDNFRKNITYLCFAFTKWEEDKSKLEFLNIHINSMGCLIELIDKRVCSNSLKSSQYIHVIIRQDDDFPNMKGQEVIIISDEKPIKIDSYISFESKRYSNFENQPKTDYYSIKTRLNS